MNYRKSYQDAYPLVTDANTAEFNGCRLAAKPRSKKNCRADLKTYSVLKMTLLQKVLALTQFDAADYVNDTFDFDIEEKSGKTVMVGWLNPLKRLR